MTRSLDITPADLLDGTSGSLMAGSGYGHGTHIAHDPQNNPPLARLCVSRLHWMRIETDRSGSNPGAEILRLELARNR